MLASHTNHPTDWTDLFGDPLTTGILVIVGLFLVVLVLIAVAQTPYPCY